MPTSFPRPDRLLEGEDPKTIYPRDARHWIQIYQEMIEFKGQLLIRVHALMANIPAAARADVLENDVGLIEDQLQRYRRRLEFWYARHWHLEGLQFDDQTRTITYREKTVSLTKREYQLLTLLMTKSPNFMSPQQMLLQGWHDSRLPEESLRTYVGRVREKIKKLGVGAEIQNKPRHGYALVFREAPRD